MIAALTEGMSIRAVERFTGIHRDTIFYAARGETARQPAGRITFATYHAKCSTDARSTQVYECDN